MRFISRNKFKFITMKKIAFVISLVALVFAFTVNTASAQKVTSADKAKTETVSTSKDAPAKSCCSKSAATSSASASTVDAKASGCAKTCSKAEAKSCCNKGTAKTDVTPVPKQK